MYPAVQPKEHLASSGVRERRSFKAHTLDRLPELLRDVRSSRDGGHSTDPQTDQRIQAFVGDAPWVLGGHRVQRREGPFVDRTVVAGR